MIDVNETGQKKLVEVLENLDSFDWNDYERGFLDQISERGMLYQDMSTKQKGFVGDMYDKLMQ
jgi:hypothetical protein